MQRLVLPVLMTISAAVLAAEVPPPVDAATLDFGTSSLTIPPAQRVRVVSPRTIEMVGSAMLHERGEWRLRLVRDLGASQSPEGLPFLRQVLQDSDSMVRAQAARAAGQIADPVVLPQLQPLLKDPDAVVRAAAVLAAARMGDEQAVSSGLGDADAEVLTAAITQATTAEHAAIISDRLERLPSSLKASALRRLGAIGSMDEIAAVTAHLSGGVSERIAAVEALARLNANQQMHHIAQALADSHPTVRRAAMRALARLCPPPQLQEYALQMLSDSDPTVRQAAAEVLSNHPVAGAISLLREQLDTSYPPLRSAARDALVAAGEASIEAAVQLLDSNHPERRIDGSLVLGRLRSSAAMQRHIELLRDGDWQVVAQAAQSLGTIGDRKAADSIGTLVQQIPSLIDSIELEQRAQLAAAATEAVIAAAKLRHQPSLQVMVQLIPQRTDWSQLRAACAWGFGILGDSSDTTTCQALLSIPSDFLELQPPKLEAIKALGHVRYAPAAAMLRQMADTSPDPQLRWMAHWAYQRITGQTLDYVPPQHRFTPDLSIVELQD